MLRIITGIEQLDFRQLMDVYEEWNSDNGAMLYPNFPANLQLLYAEQDFYCFLKDFFLIDNAKYYVWELEGRYRAALRVEPYMDGLLLEALETALKDRRKGYATALIREMLTAIAQTGFTKIYSHVSKNNISSLSVHMNCGFTILSTDSVFIDGSRHKDYYTLSLVCR